LLIITPFAACWPIIKEVRTTIRNPNGGETFNQLLDAMAPYR